MDPRVFPIHPPSTALFAKVLALLFAIICIFFALLSLIIYAVIDIDGPIGRIAAPVALGAALLLMLFIFFSVFTWFYLIGSRTSFGLIETHLVIRNSAHGQHFAYDELKTDAARIVDLQNEPQYRPGKKIFAIKAFFFYGGAFHLQNNEKAHVFYTDPRVVYIPTHTSHALLLGPTDPDGFLQALRELSGRSQPPT